MKEEKIKEIIDKYLDKSLSKGSNQLPGKIEKEMTDINQDLSKEWKIWLPINSTVSDEDIREIEGKIKHKLPKDYKIFLKHKHFYNLQISEVSFCSHPINIWKNKLLENIFNGYPNEYLIDKGYIPFADWSDWGLLCFNTNLNKNDNNYPIVLWDHEIPDEAWKHYNDFFDLIIKIDIEEESKK